MSHGKGCQCEVCDKGMAEFLANQQKMMDEHHWVAHYVVGEDDDSPTGANYHTHGLSDNFAHPDLQIVMRIRPEVAHGIFSRCVELIRSAIKFEPGKEYDRVIGGGLKVKFISRTEGEREVLRIILPSPNGALDPIEMNDDLYKKQF